MSTRIRPQRSSAPVMLFSALFDDAAIFPPGNAPMEQAVNAHLVWRASRWSSAVGPFICSSTRWDELCSHLDAASPLPISLTLPAGPASLGPASRRASTEPRVNLASVEVACRRDELGSLLGLVSDHIHPSIRTYVELPWAAIDGAVAQELARAGARAKIRTGGTRADAFPDERQLASALLACVGAGVSYKLTAGLHGAVRHRDPLTGFEHHGFLNVITATSRALAGYNLDDVVAALAEQDPVSVADEVGGLDEKAAHAVREHFESFGTCSISDPLRGLLDLGLVQEDQ